MRGDSGGPNQLDTVVTRATPWACVLVAACLFGVVRWEFAADDVLLFRTYTTVLADDQITTSWNRVFADFVGPWGGNPYVDYYRPLVTLSLALDWSLFGYHGGANAVINVLQHLGSALLVHRIALRVLPHRKAAALAALLFMSTPLAQENIAWAVGRCGLSNLFALGATLVFLRRFSAGLRGAALHAPVLALLVCALMSMESAMLWAFFPTVALFVGVRLGTIDGPDSLRKLTHLAWSHWVLAPLYVLFRIIVLGSIGGQNAEIMLQALAERHLFLPVSLLYEALIPGIRDTTWLQAAFFSITWHLLVFVPCSLGLWWSLRRSRVPGLGISIVSLLTFWFLSRVPSVHLPLRENLDTARLAYYSFPPLALILGMLFSFHRLAFLCGLVVVVGSALHLEHRIDQRVLWSRNTANARAIVLEEAASRGAILAPGSDPSSTPALAYVDQVAGIGGAPGVYPGELPLVLYPPIVNQRVNGFSLHWLITRGEVASAAAIAEQLGGLFQIFGGDATKMEPEKIPLDHTQWRDPKPVGGLEARLVPARFDPVPGLALGTAWRRDPSHSGSEPVLILIAGNESLVSPMTGDDWPQSAYELLGNWRRLAGVNASYCFMIELRTDPTDPATTRARSRLVIGGFAR